MATITQEMIDDGWENLSDKIEATIEKAKAKGENMKNNGLSLIEKYNILADIPTKLLALDGKEIPGQIRITHDSHLDGCNCRRVTVLFNVPDEESIEKKAEDEFNEIKERVYTLFNRVIYGALRGFEEVAKEMGGLTVEFSEHGIDKISLMTDIARFAFDNHPLIIWDITNTNIESAGDPTLVFKGVKKR